jgi:ribonuclease VapC
MIYVDPSAILSILLEEEDAPELRAKLATAQDPVISVVGKVEAALAVGHKIGNYDIAREEVHRFCRDTGISVMPASAEIYDNVLKAYQRYGKGTGHPAKLNFGDCFSYAFAKREGRSILFKGNDFSQTDLVAT